MSSSFRSAFFKDRVRRISWHVSCSVLGVGILWAKRTALMKYLIVLLLMIHANAVRADFKHGFSIVAPLVFGSVPRRQVRWRNVSLETYTDFVERTRNVIRDREQALSRNRREWEQVRNDFSDRINNGRLELAQVECVEKQYDETEPNARGEGQSGNLRFRSYQATINLSFPGTDDKNAPAFKGGRINFSKSSDRWPEGHILANEQFLVGWDVPDRVPGNRPQAPVLMGRYSTDERIGYDLGGIGTRTSIAIHSIGANDLAFNMEYFESIPASNQDMQGNGPRFVSTRTSIWCR